MEEKKDTERNKEILSLVKKRRELQQNNLVSQFQGIPIINQMPEKPRLQDYYLPNHYNEIIEEQYKKISSTSIMSNEEIDNILVKERNKISQEISRKRRNIKYIIRIHIQSVFSIISIVASWPYLFLTFSEVQQNPIILLPTLGMFGILQFIVTMLAKVIANNKSYKYDIENILYALIISIPNYFFLIAYTYFPLNLNYFLLMFFGILLTIFILRNIFERSLHKMFKYNTIKDYMKIAQNIMQKKGRGNSESINITPKFIVLLHNAKLYSDAMEKYNYEQFCYSIESKYDNYKDKKNISSREFEILCASIFAKYGYNIEYIIDNHEKYYDIISQKGNKIIYIKCEFLPEESNFGTIINKLSVIADRNKVRAIVILPYNYTYERDFFKTNQGRVQIITFQDLESLLKEEILDQNKPSRYGKSNLPSLPSISSNTSNLNNRLERTEEYTNHLKNYDNDIAENALEELEYIDGITISEIEGLKEEIEEIEDKDTDKFRTILERKARYKDLGIPNVIGYRIKEGKNEEIKVSIPQKGQDEED